MDKNRLPVILKSRLPTTETRSIGDVSDKPKTVSKKARRGVRLAAVLLGILMLVALILWLTPKLTSDGDNTYPLFLFLIHQSFPPSSEVTPPPQDTSTVGDTDSTALPEVTTAPDTSEDTAETTVHSTEPTESTVATEATETAETTEMTENTEEISETESPAPDTTDTQASPEPPQKPDHTDESFSSLGAYYINNTTILAPNVTSLSQQPFPDVGAVLIITSRKRDSYADGAGGVSDLAGLIKERLSDKGIQALYADATEGAEPQAVIDYYLSLYPEITLVLDLRRSAEVDKSGSLLRPLCFLDDGQNIPCAQVRFICDSRGVGADMTEQNLSLALHLRSDLFELHEQLSRPVWLREGISHSRDGVFFLTAEIGAAGNTFAEAVTAADLLSDVLCGRIGQNK